MQIFRKTWRLGALLILMISEWGISGAAEMTNPAGGRVNVLTTEADSGGVLTNRAGARLEFLTTDQAGADAANSIQGRAYLGMFDPGQIKNAAHDWALFE